MEKQILAGFSDVVKVSFFMLVVLIVYWTIGKKPAFWLLLLVLAGQLLTHISEIQKLLKVGD